MSAAVQPIALTRPVRSIISGTKKMLIDGQWLAAASGKKFHVTDPATGEVIAQVAEGDNVDIDHGERRRAGPSRRARGRQ